MNARIVLLLCVVGTPLVHAEKPVCAWVFSGGGPKSDKTRGVAFDPQGNVFLASETTGDSTVGTARHSSAGGMDCVLTKLDSAGVWQWTRSIGGSATDRAYAVACDAQGNAYVTGHYESPDAVADGVPLPHAGSYDFFVAKYAPEGKLLWIRTAGGPGYDYGHAIAVDSSGNIVVSGSFAPGAKLGDTTLVPEGSPSAVFCVKYNPEGAVLWSRIATGKLGGSGHGIAVDADNHIYIGGSLSGAGDLFGLNVQLKSSSAFVVKLDPAGKGVWHHAAPGVPSAVYHEITCDGSGRVWAAGMFKGAMTLGEQTLRSSGDKDSDGVLVHIDRSGSVVWSRHLAGPGTDYCLGVAVDGAGNAFVSGDFHLETALAGEKLTSRGAGDAFLAGFDLAGNLLWIEQAGGTGTDTAYPIAFRAPNELLIGGSSAAPAQFGDKELKESSGVDFFGAKWLLKPLR